MEFYIPAERLPPPPEHTAPPELADLPEEEAVTPEPRDLTGEEFEVPVSASPVKEDRPSLLRRMILVPIAATVATVSIVFASFGQDPLGIDFLSAGGKTAPAAPASPGGSPAALTPMVEPPLPADGVTTVYVHVDYQPTGAQYLSPLVDGAALSDAKSWVIAQGGDPAAMVLVDSQTVYMGLKLSDDAVYVGDPDDLEHIMLISGSIDKTYRRDNYYAVPVGPVVPAGPAEQADDAFPRLSNLERNGYLGYLPAHGFSVDGRLNENYITVMEMDGTRTPVLYNNSGTEVVDGSIPGLSYDGDTNTLTMTDYDGPILDINMMGNGFKIRLVGDNRLEHLGLWGFYLGGSVTFTGSGSLTVNQKQRFAMGIQMDAEWSETCLIVDSGVRLEAYGSPTATFEIGGNPAHPRDCRGAIVVSCTTMDKAIYYLAPLTLTGGTRAAGIFGEDPYYHHADDYTFGDFHDYSVVDENGDPSMHVIIE